VYIGFEFQLYLKKVLRKISLAIDRNLKYVLRFWRNILIHFEISF